MGKIPEFSRTVLPQNANYGMVDVARARGEAEAGQFRQNAQNIATRQSYTDQTNSHLNDIVLREANARNATWANESIIQFKRDASDNLATMREQRAGNPKNFQKDFDKEMDKRQQEMLKAAPSENARIATKESLANIRASYYEDNRSWERSRQAQMFGESMERAAENLNVLAYRAGQEGRDVQDLMNDAAASAVAGSTFVDPENVSRIKTTMSRSVAANYLEGMTEKNPQKARDLLSSKKFDEVLGADNIQRIDNAAEAEIKRRTAEAQAKARLALSDDMEEVQTAAKLGLVIPDNKLSDLTSRLEAAGLTEQAQSFREYQGIQTSVVSFAGKPLAQQQEQLVNMRTTIEGGDLDRVKEFAALSEVLETKQAAIKSDPWSYYAARDVVKEPAPLDFSNPEALKTELDNRRVAVQQIQDMDGLAMPLFMPNEMDGLKSAYETAKPEEVAALSTAIGTALKPDEQRSLAQAMAPKSSTLGVALAVGDPAVSEKIIMGNQIDGLVKEADVRAEVLAKLEDVVTDPVRFENINDAVYSYYKTLQFQKKDKSDTVNGDLLDQAITDIMGPVVEVPSSGWFSPNSKVLSYKDEQGAWMDGDRLGDTLKALNDDRIKSINGGKLPVGTTGAKFTAQDIYKSGRFVSNGDGMYAVIDELGEPIGNEDGSVFQINARQLEKIIKAGK